jgi:NADP-dependent 3-hydroxy acid dehydrogenase YdfG
MKTSGESDRSLALASVMKTFEGQTALITGATSAIGKAIAAALAGRSATLGLIGRNPPALRLLRENFGGRAFCYQADLAVDDDIQNLTRQIQNDFDRVDIVVHTAGVISTGRVENASVEDFDVQYRVNVRAPYLFTKTLLPLLKSSQGQVVFINSSLWLNARSGVAQYAACKYALKAIADSLRDELNDDGIRVLSVFPGRTAGPMQEALYASNGTPYEPQRLLQPDDIATAVIAALAMARTAEVTDINIRPLQKPSDRGI